MTRHGNLNCKTQSIAKFKKDKLKVKKLHRQKKKKKKFQLNRHMSDDMKDYFSAGELYPEPSFEKLSTCKLGVFF